MWLKKLSPKKFGFHPVEILEGGAINWELHCGCCYGTAEHFMLTPKENQELFQMTNLEDAEPSIIENLLEGEIPFKKKAS
jgi:hypothetical protein